jgi:large subunit ribosomal protein L17
MANLSASLFKSKHIKTTTAKAKATRRYSEKIITLAKKDSVHARRIAFKHLRNKTAVQILFDEIVPQYKNRNGGYTRVIKLGQRHGDGAEMAVLELVDFEMATKKKKAKEAKALEEDPKKKKKTKAEKIEDTSTEESTEVKKAPKKKEKVKEKSEKKDSSKKEKQKVEKTKKKSKDKSA